VAQLHDRYDVVVVDDDDDDVSIFWNYLLTETLSIKINVCTALKYCDVVSLNPDTWTGFEILISS